MDAWLAMQQSRNRWPGRMIGLPPVVALGDRDCLTVPPCPLSDSEIDWLWPRYARCRFPPATFAKRFARTPREHLTPRGKNAAVRCAYTYRRQIFGESAKKWSEADFLAAVRQAAVRQAAAASVPSAPSVP